MNLKIIENVKISKDVMKSDNSVPCTFQVLNAFPGPKEINQLLLQLEILFLPKKVTVRKHSVESGHREKMPTILAAALAIAVPKILEVTFLHTVFPFPKVNHTLH